VSVFPLWQRFLDDSLNGRNFFKSVGEPESVAPLRPIILIEKHVKRRTAALSLPIRDFFPAPLSPQRFRVKAWDARSGNILVPRRSMPSPCRRVPGRNQRRVLKRAFAVKLAERVHTQRFVVCQNASLFRRDVEIPESRVVVNFSKHPEFAVPLPTPCTALSWLSAAALAKSSAFPFTAKFKSRGKSLRKFLHRRPSPPVSAAGVGNDPSLHARKGIMLPEPSSGLC